jgi:hypothetical protein
MLRARISFLLVGGAAMLLVLVGRGIAEGYQEWETQAAHGTARPHHAKSKRHTSRSPAPSRPAGRPEPPSVHVTKADIPLNYLALYQAAAHTCPQLRWAVLAGIGKEESNHGRSTLPGVRSGENFAGAGGPMQFLAGTWAVYGRGGSRYDPRDAIPAAARLLCANGLRGTPADQCPGILGTAGEHTAIHAYNHACWYVEAVLAFARSYEGRG